MENVFLGILKKKYLNIYSMFQILHLLRMKMMTQTAKIISVTKGKIFWCTLSMQKKKKKIDKYILKVFLAVNRSFCLIRS